MELALTLLRIQGEIIPVFLSLVDKALCLSYTGVAYYGNQVRKAVETTFVR